MTGRRTFIRIGLIALFVLLSFHQKGFAEVHYIVKSGDTLYSISKSFAVAIEELKEVNNLNGKVIQPKQILLIPATRGKQRGEEIKRSSNETEPYIVSKGDTLSSISTRVGLPIDKIKKMNQLHSTELKMGQRLLLPKAEIEIEEGVEETTGPEMAKREQSADGNGNGDNHEISEPLGKWSNPGERSLFVKMVKNFLGAPYRLGGSTLKGIDCSAFVKKVYEIFDVHLPRTTREQFCIGKKVEIYQLEEGDLVFFSRRGNNAHVGIYIGDNQFVHASSSSKEIKIDSLKTPYYNKRFLKGIRVKELESVSPIL